MRRSLGLGALLLLVILLGWNQGWLRERGSSAGTDRAAVVIEKQPATFAQRTFDSAAPPADMPPLGEGEEAECDSDFTSNASVSGQLRKGGATNGTVIVTGVHVTLGLKVNVWVPVNAAPHVVEHEQGHRQISEHYYQTADQIARQIASSYLGKQVFISGADLDNHFAQALQKLSADITAEYNERLIPGPAQQRYDDLTDHSRNAVSANDAVAQALKENSSN